MSSPPPSSVIQALMDVLIEDANSGGLMTLMTDGVYSGVARSGSTKFVLVSLSTSHDEYRFEGIALTDALYLIKAVHLSTSATLARQAAARIFDVLQDQVLPISGFAHLLTQRVEEIEEVEVDDENKDIRWQHIGGLYAVVTSPL